MCFVDADLHTPLNGRYVSEGSKEITYKDVDSFRQTKDVAASNALLLPLPRPHTSSDSRIVADDVGQQVIMLHVNEQS